MSSFFSLSLRTLSNSLCGGLIPIRAAQSEMSICLSRTEAYGSVKRLKSFRVSPFVLEKEPDIKIGQPNLGSKLDGPSQKGDGFVRCISSSLRCREDESCFRPASKYKVRLPREEVRDAPHPQMPKIAV